MMFFAQGVYCFLHEEVKHDNYDNIGVICMITAPYLMQGFHKDFKQLGESLLCLGRIVKLDMFFY